MSNSHQNMILLKGGLGNQLFQYSFFLYLKRKQLPIDGLLPYYQRDTYGRTLELNKIIDDLKLCREAASDYKSCYSEDFELIKEALLGGKGKIILVGYFQNYSYVKDSSIDTIIKGPAVIQECAALHIRRGDYGHHGLLPIKYYYDALEQLNHPKFVIFTDEPNFALYYFKKMPGLVNIYPSNSSNACRDFLLLTGYRSIVMANSSYSWFAAYLAHARHGASIIMPSKWSLNGSGPGHSPTWHVIETDLIHP